MRWAIPDQQVLLFGPLLDQLWGLDWYPEFVQMRSDMIHVRSFRSLSHSQSYPVTCRVMDWLGSKLRRGDALATFSLNCLKGRLLLWRFICLVVNQILLEKGSSLKGKNLLLRSKFISFKIGLILANKVKTYLREFPPLQVYLFPLKWVPYTPSLYMKSICRHYDTSCMWSAIHVFPNHW